ncbi:uncharacterized protein LOC124645626 isoform X1 [Helicoverpa zea]|uniref:uncharacterized protein LOC124645626 isoform X1 n=1 Tax=Helicoverpa zea TaxID=7113 RepID=UPI001F594B0F|nr:uncharacterized protein LOC124645626 isoform X1 [Helicoverpa zea]
MEEELNEHDLEERLYAMLHHVDETEGNLTASHSDGLNIVESAPRSTVRRYWRTSEPTTPYQKVNVQKEPATPSLNSNKPDNNITQTNQTPKPKEEKRDSPSKLPAVDLSIFQSPVPQNIKKTIEIIEQDEDRTVLLDSSDEDEVIEVALPPKPTITIESSDEDELHIINPVSPAKQQVNVEKTTTSAGRDVTASPAPSGVSSVSDEFMRGDCIALNISSRHQDNPSFDFSLHGSDLLVQSTPSKKKKKKKTKEAVTSTPVVAATPEKATPNDECFATPKSKAKNKKQKTKLYTVTEKSIPSADVYDSDSNQSIDTNKNRNSYIVTDKSFPSTDVYESDSNLSECAKEAPKRAQNNDIESSDSSVSLDKPSEPPSKVSKRNESSHANETETTIVDLTENESFVNLDESDIQENIVMGNVSGFTEYEDYGDENVPDNNISKFGSTNIPSILNENLDFDNLKGKDKVCKRRRYSLTTLRAEMEKFYNESWGGENFNHREIQKSMSRDKSLWVIDPKDRMPPLAKRKVTCNYCNRAGHRDDTCRLKPAVCYMCGSTGHYEPRCPRKICVNCGSPNQMYSTMCRNCCNWGSVRCGECGQAGHPHTHCPDLWRRYHNTIDMTSTLERCNQNKKHQQLYCSGCTRRGHLVHTCRVTLPFSGLPINSPYVCIYRPLYQPNADKQTAQQNTPPPTTPLRIERNKRQSKSPTAHETHVNKKRNLSTCEDSERRNTKSPGPQRKTSISKEAEESNKNQTKTTQENKTQAGQEKAPNFIPICSANHDKKGNIIQDNEVSDTSDIVTSARIYITNDVIEKLKSDEGKAWLKETTDKHSVEVENAEITSFLSIKGKLGDQEAFHAELRDWYKPADNAKPSNDGDTKTENKSDNAWSALPKNRNSLLKQLDKALNSLKQDIGDPNALYKELTYLQNRHQQLLKQKVISPKTLHNNRGNINQMLKKLNMVLIGQAGLADGSAHLNELYSFQEKLMNLRQKTISNDLRKEIGQHYSLIFSALPRDDYSDLLKMYHNNVKQPSMMKKQKKKLKLNPKLNRLKIKVNSIPTQPIQNGIKEKREKREEGSVACSDPHMIQKLAFYHKRLVSSRPAGAALKKTRGELVRRLHSSIASLYRKEKMSSKNKKKVKKLQEQAQLFLSNV